MSLAVPLLAQRGHARSRNMGSVDTVTSGDAAPVPTATAGCSTTTAAMTTLASSNSCFAIHCGDRVQVQPMATPGSSSSGASGVRTSRRYSAQDIFMQIGAMADRDAVIPTNPRGARRFMDPTLPDKNPSAPSSMAPAASRSSTGDLARTDLLAPEWAKTSGRLLGRLLAKPVKPNTFRDSFGARLDNSILPTPGPRLPTARSPLRSRGSITQLTTPVLSSPLRSHWASQAQKNGHRHDAEDRGENEAAEQNVGLEEPASLLKEAEEKPEDEEPEEEENEEEDEEEKEGEEEEKNDKENEQQPVENAKRREEALKADEGNPNAESSRKALAEVAEVEPDPAFEQHECSKVKSVSASSPTAPVVSQPMPKAFSPPPRAGPAAPRGGGGGWRALPRNGATAIGGLVSTDAEVAPPCGCDALGLLRVLELPSLEEERSLEGNFQISFLAPFGEGADLLRSVRTTFGEDQRDFVLVPYMGQRTALVSLQQLGPLEALNHVRRRSNNVGQMWLGGASSLEASGCAALPEPTSEVDARSTALVYVVHATASPDEAERQLGPICATEAFYASANPKFRPYRFVMAMHEPRDLQAATATLDGGSLGEQVRQQLRARKVTALLPCLSSTRGSAKSLSGFMTQIVSALAADFCQGSRKEVLDPTEALTLTPDTAFSRTSSPTSMASSLFVAAGPI